MNICLVPVCMCMCVFFYWLWEVLFQGVVAFSDGAWGTWFSYISIWNQTSSSRPPPDSCLCVPEIYQLIVHVFGCLLPVIHLRTPLLKLAKPCLCHCVGHVKKEPAEGCTHWLGLCYSSFSRLHVVWESFSSGHSCPVSPCTPANRSLDLAEKKSFWDTTGSC